MMRRRARSHEFPVNPVKGVPVGTPIIPPAGLVATPERAGREGDSQPMPTINESVDIQSMVIADIEARRQLGIRRYGTALQANNGRNALLDAYEEAIDLTMYLKQRLVEEDQTRVP